MTFDIDLWAQVMTFDLDLGLKAVTFDLGVKVTQNPKLLIARCEYLQKSNFTLKRQNGYQTYHIIVNAILCYGWLQAISD